jgi:hypothetical protein
MEDPRHTVLADYLLRHFTAFLLNRIEAACCPPSYLKVVRHMYVSSTRNKTQCTIPPPFDGECRRDRGYCK